MEVNIEKKNGFWIDFNFDSVNIVEIKSWLEKLNCKYNPQIKLEKIYIPNNILTEWNYIQKFKLVISIFNKILSKYTDIKITKADAKFENRNEFILSSRRIFEHRNNKYLTCFFQLSSTNKELETINICITENTTADDIENDIETSITNIILFQSLPQFNMSTLLSKFNNDIICIATPLFSGRLIHESIGHHTEADIFETNRLQYDYLGKQICDSSIIIVDYANGKNIPNNYYIDEEGSDSRDVTIVNRGILSGILSDKEHNITKYHDVAGVVRSYKNNAYPLIRMRNTALLPGKYTQNEILTSVKSGIFLNQYTNGHTDIYGNFEVEAENAYIIDNGKIIAGLKKIKLNGAIYEFINSISMLGCDFRWYQDLWCEKDGFRVPIACGAPTIKCKLNISK